ncbi:MAG: hypothetical protein AMXMBFR34_03130 [Myxococcaceae bacterium]
MRLQFLGIASSIFECLTRQPRRVAVRGFEQPRRHLGRVGLSRSALRRLARRQASRDEEATTLEALLREDEGLAPPRKAGRAAGGRTPFGTPARTATCRHLPGR